MIIVLGILICIFINCLSNLISFFDFLIIPFFINIIFESLTKYISLFNNIKSLLNFFNISLSFSLMSNDIYVFYIFSSSYL